MPYYLLYALFSFLTGHPLLILAVLAVVYFLIDRRFIGLLPDVVKVFRRSRYLRRLREEIRLNPANAHAQLELGAIYLERGDPRQALPLLEKGLERMDDSARLLSLLGECRLRLGMYTEAEKNLAEAVALNPKIRYGVPYYHLLQLALRRQADIETRDALVEKILGYGSPEVFYRAGRALMKAGDRTGAKRMFQEAVDNYNASSKGFRRTHRRWALGAKIFLRFMT